MFGSDSVGMVSTLSPDGDEYRSGRIKETGMDPFVPGPGILPAWQNLSPYPPRWRPRTGLRALGQPDS
jgi:hypothetical protein